MDLPRFEAPKRPQYSFGVQHYAGQVIYSTEQLIDKNKDFTIQEHANYMQTSKNPFIRCALSCTTFFTLGLGWVVSGLGQG